MSTFDSTTCPHGHAAPERPRADLGPGWVERHADGCPLCLGASAGIAYKPKVQSGAVLYVDPDKPKDPDLPPSQALLNTTPPKLDLPKKCVDCNGYGRQETAGGYLGVVCVTCNGTGNQPDSTRAKALDDPVAKRYVELVDLLREPDAAPGSDWIPEFADELNRIALGAKIADFTARLTTPCFGCKGKAGAAEIGYERYCSICKGQGVLPTVAPIGAITSKPFSEKAWGQRQVTRECPTCVATGTTDYNDHVAHVEEACRLARDASSRPRQLGDTPESLKEIELKKSSIVFETIERVEVPKMRFEIDRGPYAPGTRLSDRGKTVTVVGWAKETDATGRPQLRVRGEDGHEYVAKPDNLDPLPQRDLFDGT